MIQRWSAVLNARLAHGEGTEIRTITARIAANALQLSFTPHAMKTCLALRANVVHYLQHRRYRRLRPQVAHGCCMFLPEPQGHDYFWLWHQIPSNTHAAANPDLGEFGTAVESAFPLEATGVLDHMLMQSSAGTGRTSEQTLEWR